MKYEIINPSDKCFIASDNKKVAQFCNLLLGSGMYGLRDEDGNDVVGCLYLFGTTQESLNADFDGDFKKFGKDHAKEIAACFKTFEYANGRTSLNDIGARARHFAEAFEKMAQGVEA